jgi:tetrapyrrole methylase family protein/MazG family protein
MIFIKYSTIPLFFYPDMKKTTTAAGKNFSHLVALVRQLRSPKGCPWDRKQTAESLKRYLEEETRELLEAIDSGNQLDVMEESGDLLYIIILLAQIHTDEGHFTIEDAIEAISAKMVRRHPHVFTDERAGSAAELREKWLQIKDREKSGRPGAKKN